MKLVFDLLIMGELFIVQPIGSLIPRLQFSFPVSTLSVCFWQIEQRSEAVWHTV